MKKLALLLTALALLWPSLGWTQPTSRSAPPSCNVAQLAAGTCAPARLGARVRVRNSDAVVDLDCASGEGANAIVCEYNGTAWQTARPATDFIRFCGEATTINNNTIYYGPSRTLTALGQTCDINAAGNATENNVKDDVFEQTAFKVLGMVCRNEADANADITFTLRADNANMTPSVACTIPDDIRECVANTQTTVDIPANSQVALAASSTGDIGDNNGFMCRVRITF